jgi:hypothetical protein
VKRLVLIRGAFTLAGLGVTGCAAEGTVHRPPLEQHSVVGSGTSNDRSVIDTSNQKFFDVEHAGETTNVAPVVNAGIP